MISVISIPFMAFLLLADLNDPFRFHGLVPSATFGIQKLEQFLESAGICGIAEKGALSERGRGLPI
jgi:hypothetical protein